jgi:hypothetical protein
MPQLTTDMGSIPACLRQHKMTASEHAMRAIAAGVPPKREGSHVDGCPPTPVKGMAAI